MPRTRVLAAHPSRGADRPPLGESIHYGSFNPDANFTVSGIKRISTEEADDGDRHYGPSEQRTFRDRGFEFYDR